MKISTVFIFLFIGIFTMPLLAQETLWLNVEKDTIRKEDAIYYRPEPKKVADGFWLIDYFIEGTKQMEGLTTETSLGKEQFEGIVTYYFKSGQIYKELHYEEGLQKGIYKGYYSTGEVKEMGTFEEGKKDGAWKFFYKNGKIQAKGKYRNGEKVGVWKIFYKNVYK